MNKAVRCELTAWCGVPYEIDVGLEGAHLRGGVLGAEGGGHHGALLGRQAHARRVHLVQLAGVHLQTTAPPSLWTSTSGNEH